MSELHQAACQFFVEDVVASKRYVVTLRPEDISRVRCRTIRRHLLQSVGFPYRAQDFDLFCDTAVTSASRPLEEDATGTAMGLRSGAVLLLLQHSAVSTTSQCAPRTSSSPKLAEVRTSSCDPEHSTEDGEWMSGLSERQRRLQAQLLDEFRRSSSESPSPPQQTRQSLFPTSRNLDDADGSPSAYVVGKGWVGESAVLASPMVPSRSTSQTNTRSGATSQSHAPHHHDATPVPSRRSESVRYEMTPDVDASSAESPQLIRTSEESYHAAQPSDHRFSASTSLVATNNNKTTPHVRGTMDAESNSNAPSNHNHKESNHRGDEYNALCRQVESLTQRVHTISSANEAAQREIRALQEDLRTTEELLESETSRANTLHDAAVMELRQQLGFKFVKSQSEFDVIVRNFAKKKELEAKCNRAAESQKELMHVLQAEQAKRRALQSFVEDIKGNIRVVVRIRPPPHFNGARGRADDLALQASTSSHPPNDAVLVTDTAKGILTVQSATSGTKAFEFYRVLGPATTQKDVFAEVAPLVQSAVDGSNVCVFAYGQTGSGKTHTMLGGSAAAHHADSGVTTISAGPIASQGGLIPRAVAELFRLVHERIDSESCIMCSLVELYNEQLFDMLAQQPNEKLDVRPLHSLAASMHQVRTMEEALHLLTVGGSTRQIHETKLNTQSSRSHLVFTMHIALRHADRLDSPNQESKMTFVDLAGSERVAHTQSVGDRLKEAQYINKSLSALGDVIASLSSHDTHHHQQQQHVPYRNSKLTLLLQDCIGGHSKTMLLACIAPTSLHHAMSQHDSAPPHGLSDWGAAASTTALRLANLQETISTLQFAARVRLVRNGQLSRSPAMKYVASIASPPPSHYAPPTAASNNQPKASVAAPLIDNHSTSGLRTAVVNHPRSHSKTPPRAAPMKF
jgi:hypothetical protein